MKLIILCRFFLVPAILAVPAYAAQDGGISCAEVRELRSAGAPLRIIDVRTAYEFGLVHIPEAVNIPAAEIGRAQLPKSESLVLYCLGNGCGLSATAARTLSGLGYQNARVLKGGLLAWEAAGLPLAAAPVSVSAAPPLPPSGISPDELKSRLEAHDGLLVLDLRPPLEFAAGHIPGARNLPLEELGGSSEALRGEREIVVYDRLSDRSKRAARSLSAKAVNVRILSGGLVLWSAKGYPLSTQNENIGK